MKNLSEINGKILEVGNKDYSIVLIDGLTDDNDSLGECNYRKCQIKIDSSLVNSPATMLEVVLHEIQHALNERFLLNKLKDEESFTDQQAVAWSTALLRNRWLVDFIALARKK